MNTEEYLELEELKYWLRSQGTPTADSWAKKVESIEIKLESAIERMDRARDILTDVNLCNWAMLDTSDLKS